MSQVDSGYDHRKDHHAYMARKSEMEQKHLGKTALLHNGKIVSIEDESTGAYQKGCKQFGLGHFSLEEIGQEPFKLGAIGIGL